MHVHFLDSYRPRASLIHRIDPRIKLVLTVAFILTSTLLPGGAWPIYFLFFALLLSVEIISELGVTFVLKRSSLALPFVLTALPLILTIPGKTLFNLSVGPWIIHASVPGLIRFVSIAIKSWLSVQAAIVLAASTSFPDLLLAIRALHVPQLLVSIFGLMWRYLFVLVDEAARLMRARASRSGLSDLPGARPGGSIPWRARVTGGMAGSLFLRAFERSDRIYMAMVSRGYDGEVRTLPLPAVQPTQWVVLIASLSLLGTFLGIAYLMWG
ncbi:MAG: cobalt ECF transporter T component CbiQ [Chloroflexi bacterium RBG_13_50_21]|nr:MAG: cobalt ECF transporter T component CbiQ [Chloroflexi bacterium RBG_13_50_21]OGO64860.1 MAG: cobalt ECF transporter T component CbiQ [Chloroflexi bacterium RBG_19FT_COMBO_50_10]